MNVLWRRYDEDRRNREYDLAAHGASGEISCEFIPRSLLGTLMPDHTVQSIKDSVYRSIKKVRIINKDDPVKRWPIPMMHLEEN